MRKIKEVLRLKWEKGFSAHQIADSCDISRSTVKDYLDKAQIRGITWPLPDDLNDAAVEHLLFRQSIVKTPINGICRQWITSTGS
jgi:predicted transcriptional regulator